MGLTWSLQVPTSISSASYSFYTGKDRFLDSTTRAGVTSYAIFPSPNGTNLVCDLSISVLSKGSFGVRSVFSFPFVAVWVVLGVVTRVARMFGAFFPLKDGRFFIVRV